MTSTDPQIDALVYELYGLTEEEIKIVDVAAEHFEVGAGAFRLRTANAQHILEVDVITWGGPHDMLPLWRKVRSWRHRPTQARLDRATSSALANPRFFRRCKYCKGLTPRGYFDDELECCMPCATAEHSVLY